VNEQRPCVLYVVSRFPSVTETFVVNEWWRLSARFRMEFASLLEESEKTLHAQTERLLPNVRFLPLLGRGTLGANAAALASSPARYLGMLLDVLRSSRGRPAGGVLKGAVVFWKSVALARVVRELGVDHIHAHFINHPATAAWIVSRLTGISYSVTAHANDLFVEPALLERKVADASFVVAISEYNRSYLRRRVPDAGRIELVHCGVALGEFPFGEREGGARLVSVGRLEPTKGHDDLLRAFAELAPDFPQLTLDVVGAGPEGGALTKLARELGLDRRVRFLGALPTDGVKEILREADVFVLAARRHVSGRMDGIPVALMEAMASGVPVVATALSGIPELVVDGVTGIVVPPHDPARLSAALRRLVEDPPLRSQLARQAREHVASHFDLDVEAERLGDLFQDVVGAGRGSRTRLAVG
jgi:colanic acid/amylovoran biosynthesis glycosyltransferase